MEKNPGQQNALVGVQTESQEPSFPHGLFKLEKFHCDEKGQPIGDPFEVLEFLNAYVNTGGALLLDLLIGAGGTVFSNANAHIGVGDSNTAVAAGQTDLQAATNKLRKAMDSTFPSRAGQVMTWRSTFASGDANFVWAEIALFNNSAAGTMLSRIVQAMGTKVVGTSWVATYTITVP
jgi:hypothetical protein